MYSRTKKWAKYRLSIKNTPDNKFPKASSSASALSTSESFTPISAGSGDNIEGKERHDGPYDIYLKRKRLVLLGKLGVALLVTFFLLFIYLAWVRGN